MYPHRINLREPWQAISQGQSTLFRRAFRWPTELMLFEQLWLVVGYADAPFQVAMNQKDVASQQEARVPLEMDITQLIQNQNLLEISSLQQVVDNALGTVHNVFLEVRRSVHICSLVGNCLWNSGKPSFELTASIRGPVERKLSVVIRLNDKEICYQELLRTDTPIHIRVENLVAPQWLPRQANELQNLEIQLLDPSCVLAQHHYLTGFSDPVEPNGMSCVPFPADEPIFESPWLAEADRMGKLVSTNDINPEVKSLYLWHHPSIMAMG